MNHPCRRAFTMLELLVVITIIAVLASGSMVAVGILKKRSNRFLTAKMIAEEVVVAMNTYLAQWPALGDTSAKDFQAQPWQYLYTRPKRTAAGEMTELSAKRLVKVAKGSDDCQTVARPEQATHILDYFGTGVDNLLKFTVIEGGSSRSRFTKAVEIRSSAGTPSVGRDDIIYRFVSSCDKATKSYSLGDAGKFVLVDKVLSDWKNPLDTTSPASLDDAELQKALVTAK